MNTEVRDFKVQQVNKSSRSQLVPIVILIIFAFVGIDKLAGFYTNGRSLMRTSWVAFSDRDGRFTVDMPVQPQNVTQMASAAAAANLHMFRAVRSGGQEAYSVCYTDCGEDVFRSATPDNILDRAISGPSHNSNKTLISSCTVIYNGNPGREAIFSDTSGGHVSLQKLRVYLVEHRLYLLMFTTNGASVDTPNAKHFIESFKILK